MQCDPQGKSLLFKDMSNRPTEGVQHGACIRAYGQRRNPRSALQLPLFDQLSVSFVSRADNCMVPPKEQAAVRDGRINFRALMKHGSRSRSPQTGRCEQALREKEPFKLLEGRSGSCSAVELWSSATLVAVNASNSALCSTTKRYFQKSPTRSRYWNRATVRLVPAGSQNPRPRPMEHEFARLLSRCGCLV
jgi:hypothetical protein